MNHEKTAAFYLFLFLVFAHCNQKNETCEEQILIKGGWIIHTGWNSTPEDDIENRFVLISKGKIQRIGSYSDTISYPAETYRMNKISSPISLSPNFRSTMNTGNKGKAREQGPLNSQI